MKRVSLEQLSDLVLLDIMAALPMCAAVHFAQLGHQRLQAMSCRPWVFKRMADVSFPSAVKAYQAGGRVREAFCSEVVLKRLYGRIDEPLYQKEDQFRRFYGRIYKPSYQMQDHFPRQDILAVLSKVPGCILWNLKGYEIIRFLEEVSPAISCKIKYISNRSLRPDFVSIEDFPNIIVCSSFRNERKSRVAVYYRPALLNGRHVVDVLKAVRKPLVVSEAELDRVRREATGNAEEISYLYDWEENTVWSIDWESCSVDDPTRMR